MAAEADGADPVLLSGRPALRLAEWAREAHPDVIVAASHAGRVAGALGSTTRRLAMSAPCPALILPPGAEPGAPPGPGEAPYAHVACCIDDSPGSMRALAEARRLRALGPGRLSLVHVAPHALIEEPVPGGAEGAPRDIADDDRAWLAATAAGVPGAEAVALRAWRPTPRSTGPARPAPTWSWPPRTAARSSARCSAASRRTWRGRRRVRHCSRADRAAAAPGRGPDPGRGRAAPGRPRRGRAADDEPLVAQHPARQPADGLQRGAGRVRPDHADLRRLARCPVPGDPDHQRGHRDRAGGAGQAEPRPPGRPGRPEGDRGTRRPPARGRRGRRRPGGPRDPGGRRPGGGRRAAGAQRGPRARRVDPDRRERAGHARARARP